MSEPKRGGRPGPRSFTPWSLRVPVLDAPEAISVLVVDGDAVSRKFLERSLHKRGAASGALTVETVRDAGSAFEVLRNSMVDIVIADTDLQDMGGLRFLTLLRSETRFESVPFVFLSVDTRTATRVAALEAGASDCLEKPYDPELLAARVRSLVLTERRRREDRQQRNYNLAGDFSVMALPDIASLLELAHKSGRLRIVTARATGELVFKQGVVWSATFGTLSGAQAFYRMLSEHQGRYEFVAGDMRDVTRTVFDNATALILEGARLLDESRSTGDLAMPEAPQSVRLMSPHMPSDRAAQATMAPPMPPRVALAEQFAAGIADSFRLGELRVWTDDELTRWTQAAGAPLRFHVHLVAPLGPGIPALLALAAPPGEQWTRSALRSEPKSLGATFFLRGERQLDIVLIDAYDVDARLHCLKRTPALTIVAPPNGDLLALGTEARRSLDDFVSRTRPTLLFGVGSSAMQQYLVEIRAVEDGLVTARCARGALGEGRMDLRTLLVDAIRRWGALENDPQAGEEFSP